MPYFFDIIIRLLVPLTIIRWPWWGFVFALFADGVDLDLIRLIGPAFDPNFSIDFGRYQTQDKWLDLYMFAVCVYAASKWPDKLAYRTAVALFWFRFLGVLLFEITGTRWLLLLFPNVLEFFYLFRAFMLYYFPEFQIKTGKRLAILLVPMFILKFHQEYFMHIRKISYWQYLEHEIFRRPR